MSAIVKMVPKISKIVNPQFTQIRTAYWNKDFKPGPVPITPEELKAAAKKYNLLPNEYKPYADDGMGSGDYPELPKIAVESLDPYYPYDYPESKRNYAEPVHAEYDLIDQNRYGTAEPLRYPLRIQAGAFFLAMFASFGLYYYLDDKRMFRPLLPRQYPEDGKIHYTFVHRSEKAHGEDDEPKCKCYYY